jgi:hypothetical protein
VGSRLFGPDTLLAHVLDRVVVDEHAAVLTSP